MELIVKISIQEYQDTIKSKSLKELLATRRSKRGRCYSNTVKARSMYLPSIYLHSDAISHEAGSTWNE